MCCADVPFSESRQPLLFGFGEKALHNVGIEYLLDPKQWACFFLVQYRRFLPLTLERIRFAFVSNIGMATGSDHRIQGRGSLVRGEAL
jgi:hypothetical protein